MCKYSFLLIATAVFFLQCGQPRRVATHSGRISVLSYNIHHGNPPTQPKGFIDLDTIAATIRSSRADLVAIQELDSQTVRSNKVYQLKELAEKLNMFYHFERTIPYESGAYGIGILSKYPIEEVIAFPLPGLKDVPTEPRKLLLSKVNMRGKPLYFACTHIDYKNKDVNLLQLKELVRVLDSLPDTPLIFGGDFNTTPDSEGIQWVSAHFKNAGSNGGNTIPVINPQKRIDFIFYKGKGLSVVKDGVMAEHNYGSDHLPVLTEFGVK